MATDAVPGGALLSSQRLGKVGLERSAIDQALAPLASLKLTVVLFSLSMIIILVGTLAQVNMDMWEVMDRYFMSWICWVDFQVFFPRSFFPNTQSVPGGIWFPGGAAIGLGLVINLTAAFLTRFKIQAKGNQRLVGFAVLALGGLLTWVVIASGHNAEGFQGESPIAPGMLWAVVKFALAGCTVAAIVGGITLPLSGESRTVECVLLTSFGILLGALTAYLFFTPDLDDSGMRILWQLILGTTCGLVLLPGTILLYRKRGPVVTIHLGIALLMFGQYWVAKYDVEEQIRLEEGQKANYATDIRQTELAIVTAEDERHDNVVVVPKSILQASAGDVVSLFSRASSVNSEGVIQDDSLPFDIQVVEYLKNADLHDVEEGAENLATKGRGLKLEARPAKAASGTDSSGRVDLAAAYVKLTGKDGSDLGTYLLSQIMAMQDIAETVEYDGREYDLSLRFQRNYKPYSVRLLDVRKDDYVGTSIPRNYSSDIQLTDESRDTDRKIHIWMNNPLRYAGETFYQSGYTGPPDTQREATTLSVVTNQGWMIPYVACMIVVVGLLAHFNGTLLRFLKRRAATPVEEVQLSKKAAKRARRQQQANSPGIAGYILPAIVVGVFALILARMASVPSYDADEIDMYAFGQLPVIADGRVKPFDSLAQNSLRMISNRTTFRARKSSADLKSEWAEIANELAKKYRPVEAAAIRKLDGDVKATVELIEEQTQENRYRIEETVDKLTTERMPAIRWLLDAITDPEIAEQHKIFRIENLEVLDTLGLERRKGFLYSVEEIRGGVAEFEKQVAASRKKDVAELSTYERKLIELDNRIRVYTRLSAAFQPPPLPELPTPDEVKNDNAKAMEKMERFRRVYFGFLGSIDSIRPPLAVPTQGEDGEDKWECYAKAWTQAFIDVNIQQKELPPAMKHMNTMLVAYEQGDAKEFNKQVSEYAEFLQDPDTRPEQLRTADTFVTSFVQSRFGSFYNFEAYFNHVTPFFFCWWPYLAAFVLSAGAWLGWSKQLNRTAFALIAFTFLIHSLALLARMYISGRPPVTNLYSSAVFIGWGVVLFGLILEGIFRDGVGNVMASSLGFASLIVAHYLALDGDTFTVLQAVLDTQFWLAVHVVTVTLGYATTFLAGFLGIQYVTRMFRGTPANAAKNKDIARMIYGIVCFSLFFSFFGTVLGGLWADDSWGRFWGWDPKENGALMIVLWNALVLHARWGGLVREKGLAVLAILGNIVTSWSWFGVNELGVGLHSYGFTDGVLLVLLAFWISQLAIVGVAIGAILAGFPRSSGQDPTAPA